MADKQELLDKAKGLGEALAAHPVVAGYHAAQRAVRADQQATDLLQAYQTQAAHIRQLEEQQQPIEPAEKQKLKDYEAQMAGNDAMKQLMKAQADYIQLMNEVNDAMEAPLRKLAQPEPEA